MKKYIRRLWVKFLIGQLKKGAVKSESVMRILIHYTLLEMQKRKVDQIEIEYSEPESTKTKLLLIGYLTDKE